jgi:thymidylate synthase (FAD)
MIVKLVSHSKATSELESFGIEDAQDLVAYCARVSNPQNQFNSETSERLIQYLIKHQHWSPLEMVSVCMRVDTTRDIGRQILRHRSFSFQEFSQRYADVRNLGDWFELRECRMQDSTNRQNSTTVDLNTDDGRRLAWMWEQQQKRVIDVAKEVYSWAIDAGIAKEQARAVLPEGLTRSTMYMNGTLRSWVHYVQLRGENGTQLEHMQIAKACATVIADIFPIAKSWT